MKTYRTFVAFTLSTAFVFGTSYLSSAFFDDGAPSVTTLYSLGYGVPSKNMFIVFWGIVYACMVSLMTVTVANRCLRRGAKLFLILGAINVLFCLLYFKLQKEYYGLPLLLLSLTVEVILTNFYVKNTRLAWALTVPMLALQIYSIFLTVMLLLS